MIFVNFEPFNQTEIDVIREVNDKSEELNIYVDPYQFIWSKIIATISYMAGLALSAIIFSFIKGEVEDQKKTVINLLLAFGYILVIDYSLGDSFNQCSG